MATTSEIPLLPGIPQTFNITLVDTTYKFRVQWREALAQSWILDIMNVDGTELLTGVPLLPGVDLLEQYTDLGFPGQLWVTVDADPQAAPTFTNLGVASHLLFVVP